MTEERKFWNELYIKRFIVHDAVVTKADLNSLKSFNGLKFERILSYYWEVDSNLIILKARNGCEYYKLTYDKNTLSVKEAVPITKIVFDMLVEMVEDLAFKMSYTNYVCEPWTFSVHDSGYIKIYLDSETETYDIPILKTLKNNLIDISDDASYDNFNIGINRYYPEIENKNLVCYLVEEEIISREDVTFIEYKNTYLINLIKHKLDLIDSKSGDKYEIPGRGNVGIGVKQTTNNIATTEEGIVFTKIQYVKDDRDLKKLEKIRSLFSDKRVIFIGSKMMAETYPDDIVSLVMISDKYNNQNRTSYIDKFNVFNDNWA